MSLKTKRERSTNFIDNELELLVDLVVKQKKILENKKTDAITANIKNKTWEVLTKTFNSKSLNGYRSEKCLRSKYDNLKKTVKIKLREVKSKPCPTGGGPAASQKTIEKLSFIEEKIRSLNPLAFNGTTSQFDNDCIDNESMKLIDELDLENDEVEIVMDEVDCQENNSEDLFNTTDHVNEIDWADYTPAKLKTPISKQLSHSLITPQNRSGIVCGTSMYDNESSDNDLEEIENPKKNTATKGKSVYRRKQSSIINVNNDWAEVAKIKTDVLNLKKKLLEEELDFKRKENTLKLEKLSVELGALKKQNI